ncbi:MAG: arsenite methyltransferase [Candidatus Latescibacteria bacterium]|nr:arsenite methyltransferase [Candidatus Latescibacterota bacterium]
MNAEQAKEAVRSRYGAIAEQESTCCATEKSCGCGAGSAEQISGQLGYSDAEMAAVPEGANLGLGCGNPVALAGLQPGETVLDLGSGAGFDCFLAAAQVGPAGRVIGVDMTPQMVAKARDNARKGGYENVEFRLGEIEHLPVAAGEVDLIMSNCVINLVPDKGRAFAEAFRVLKPGGRLMVSDIVLTGELPVVVRDLVAAYTGCISGASRREEYLAAMRAAGFVQVEILGETGFSADCIVADPTVQAETAGLSEDEIAAAVAAFVSVRVKAVKPLAA